MDSVRQALLRAKVQNGTASPSDLAELQRQNMVDTANSDSFSRAPSAPIEKRSNDTQYMMTPEERSRMNQAYSKYNQAPQGSPSLDEVKRQMQQNLDKDNEQESVDEWSKPRSQYDAEQMGDADKQAKLAALQKLRGR